MKSFKQLLEDIQVGPAPEEISYKGYTTKNLHHVPDAAKAFQATITRVQKGTLQDNGEVLAALKATDTYMKLNDMHLEQEKDLDSQELDQWLASHEEAKSALTKIGEFEHHYDYWNSHNAELQYLKANQNMPQEAESVQIEEGPYSSGQLKASPEQLKQANKVPSGGRTTTIVDRDAKGVYTLTMKDGKEVSKVYKESTEIGEASKLQGTPVVSLSDFGSKDNTKNKYGQTVPKKLKPNDPRVKMYTEPKKEGVAEGSKIPMVKDPETGRKHPDYGNTGMMRNLAAAAQKRKSQTRSEPTKSNPNDLSKYNDFPDTNKHPWMPVMIGEPSWANIPKSLEVWARRKGIHRDIGISHDPKGEIWTIKGKSGYPHDTEYTYRWKYDYDGNQFEPVEEGVAEGLHSDYVFHRVQSGYWGSTHLDKKVVVKAASKDEAHAKIRQRKDFVKKLRNGDTVSWRLAEGLADDFLAMAKNRNPNARIVTAVQKRKEAEELMKKREASGTKPAHAAPTSNPRPLGGYDPKSGRSYSESVESIDEISAELKQKYLAAATKKHLQQFLGREKVRDKQELDKRRAAIQKTSKELTGKTHYQESVELDESLKTHYQNGYDAQKKGKTRQDNPHREGTPAASMWAKGWEHSSDKRAPQKFANEQVELEEKTLTPAELKKREEVAKAMERKNPNMDKSRKMAIATAVAKRVAEQYDDAE